MDRPMKIVLLVLLFCCILGSYWLFTVDTPFQTRLSGSTGSVRFQETFNAGFLDPERWETIQEGDVRQNIIDVVPVDPVIRDEYRMRLGMNTIGTRDDTVKYIGIRSIDPISIPNSSEISFDFDWNNQSNGCYLTAAMYLCPTVTNTNPEREEDWLKFEYIGVPPGQNARAVIAMKDNGTVKYLYTEGWPEERRGRRIGFQQIRLIPDTNGISILENEILLYHLSLQDMKVESGYLYFQMSSHSNYPFREVYFDNITVS